jgi:hypothetical protein
VAICQICAAFIPPPFGFGAPLPWRDDGAGQLHQPTSDRSQKQNRWVRGQKRTRVRFMFFDIFFSGVFELPLLRSKQKRDKTKKVEEKLTLKKIDIFGKRFSTWILFKNGIFELPLPRNAQKRTKQKNREKESRLGGGRVWDLANSRGGPSKKNLTAPRW